MLARGFLTPSHGAKQIRRKFCIITLRAVGFLLGKRNGLTPACSMRTRASRYVREEANGRKVDKGAFSVTWCSGWPE